MLERARNDPAMRFVGLDASHASLIDASRQAARPTSKGGAPNAIFVLGSAETLPGPLAGQATSVSILFPWGSLLQAVLRPDEAFLRRLAELCRPGAVIEVVTALHPEADAAELARLGLTGGTMESAAEGWRNAGFDAATETLPADHAYQTTWWRKIRQREGRVAMRLTATFRGAEPPIPSTFGASSPTFRAHSPAGADPAWP